MKLFEEMFLKEAKLPSDIKIGDVFKVKNNDDEYVITVLDIRVQNNYKPETAIKFSWTKNGKDKKTQEQTVEMFLNNWWG